MRDSYYVVGWWSQVAFGDAFSFAFIWTMFFVLVNGSLAIVAISSARYFLVGVCNYGLNEVFRIWSLLLAGFVIDMLKVCKMEGMHLQCYWRLFVLWDRLQGPTLLK